MDKPVVLAVQGAIRNDKDEESEIERRKTNLIVHGVRDS